MNKILAQNPKELQLGYSIDKINEVAEELNQLLKEGEFAARWELIRTYHDAGLLILHEFPKQTKRVVAGLALKIGRSERTLWYAVAFAKKYPTLDVVPEGKNISWNKVVTKYLTKEKSEDDPCEHEFIEICKKCGFRKSPGGT